jgi:hypothetical protein
MEDERAVQAIFAEFGIPTTMRVQTRNQALASRRATT